MKRIQLIALLALMLPSVVSAADLYVIVNRSNPVSEISSADAAAMLMKKKLKWDDGTLVTPVDQTEAAEARATFSDRMLHKTPYAVKSYWRQQIFSGLDSPPVEVRNDAEVIAFVRANRGGIGYIGSNAQLDGVKVVAVH
jgi:ABC-type phosphate transport system substrate-binding protein